MGENEIKRILADARFKFRSDSLKNWQENNPVLLEGEAGVVTGLNAVGDGLEDKTQKIKFGDGIHDWNTLDWWYGPAGQSGGSNVTVDQEYNPESENAQSGIAVAEAIERIVIYNEGEPTIETEGQRGTLYINMFSKDMDIYKCIDTKDVYIKKSYKIPQEIIKETNRIPYYTETGEPVYHWKMPGSGSGYCCFDDDGNAYEVDCKKNYIWMKIFSDVIDTEVITEALKNYVTKDEAEEIINGIYSHMAENYYTKLGVEECVTNAIGDIETTLENIIAKYGLGGETV